jgi:hypothetical protein
MKLTNLFSGWLMLGALLALGATGCDGKCSGTYNCPAGVPFASLSTSNLPSALVEVSADAPCTATLVAGDGGATSVSVVDDQSNETLTCHLHGHLVDGRAVTATVSFQSATISCCAGFVGSGGVFMLSDAGTDGP